MTAQLAIHWTNFDGGVLCGAKQWTYAADTKVEVTCEECRRKHEAERLPDPFAGPPQRPAAQYF